MAEVPHVGTRQRLKLSKDRKVTPLGINGGKRNYANGTSVNRGMVPKISNSFGLPAGTSCPGKTGFCESCYAGKSEDAWPNVDKAMRYNWEVLALWYRQWGVDGYVALLDEAIDRWEAQAEYQDLPPEQWVFRIHWDGDFFSEDYAKAWATVAHKHPKTQFWAYTRSFTPKLNVVPHLATLENLTLYLSVDEENYQSAVPVLDQHPSVMIAACAVDYRSARNLRNRVRSFASPPRASLPCPENKGTMPLISTDGVGACIECGVCIRGARDILFSTSHKEDLSNGQELLFDYLDHIKGGETSVRLSTSRPTKQEKGRPGHEETEPQGKRGTKASFF